MSSGGQVCVISTVTYVPAAGGFQTAICGAWVQIDSVVDVLNAGGGQGQWGVCARWTETLMASNSGYSGCPGFSDLAAVAPGALAGTALSHFELCSGLAPSGGSVACTAWADVGGYLSQVGYQGNSIDYGEAGEFWGFAFVTVLTFWLVSRVGGTILSAIR